MGSYLNPGCKGFEESLNSAIYVDKTGLIEKLMRLLTHGRNIFVSAVRGDLENLWRRICWQHITIRASIRRGCLILCRLQRQRLIRNTGINMMC